MLRWIQAQRRSGGCRLAAWPEHNGQLCLLALLSSTALPLPMFGRVGPTEVQAELPAIAAPPRPLHEARNAIAGRTTWMDGGPALCSRVAEKAGRSASSAKRTPLSLGRAKRVVHPPPLSSLHHACWEGQARGRARRGRAAASWGLRATPVPGGRRPRTAAKPPPAGAA
jgi:hypothetical protein